LSGNSHITMDSSSVLNTMFAIESVSSYYPISVFYPTITLAIANTAFNVFADELDVDGAGYLDFNGGSWVTYSSVSAVNATSTFPGVTIASKSFIWLVNFYIDGGVFARIVNFTYSSGKGIFVIKVSHMLPILPPLVSIQIGSTVINYPPGPSSPPVINIEFPGTIDPIPVSVSHSYLLESYGVYINGSLIDTGEIYETSFATTIDPNSYITEPAIYVLRFEVRDVYGLSTIVVIYINVEASQPPQITRTPTGSIEFELGMSPPNIEWVITESNPDYFKVLINGTVLFSGTYKSGDVITLNVAGNFTSPGTYNVTLVAYDSVGNMARDTVVVKVYPSEPPTITSKPEDTTVYVNQSITLNWTANDRYPSTYDIYINGTKVVSDQTWSSGTPVQYTFTQSNTGKYNITIIFKDKAGNAASHTVWITVEQQPTGPGPSQGVPPAVLVGIIIALIAIIVVVALVRRRG